jgi:hypothetical protein
MSTSDFSALTKTQLTDMIKKHGGLLDLWALPFMNKDYLVELFDYMLSMPDDHVVKLSDDDVKSFRLKQQQVRVAHPNLPRGCYYSLQDFVESTPKLTYVERRFYKSKFISVLGSAASHGVVFKDAEGKEHILTKNETKQLYDEFGVDMPQNAWQYLTGAERDKIS